MKPFQKINEACRTTGLSKFYLRNGCRDGTIPCIRSGKTYLVNIPALYKKYGIETHLFINDNENNENAAQLNNRNNIIHHAG